MLDKINDIDMLEPLRLKNADIIYEGHDGMIFIERRSQTLMISMQDKEKFKDIYEKENLGAYDLIDVKQKDIVDILVNEYQKTYQFACYQAGYFKKEKLPVSLPTNVKIQLLTKEYANVVHQNYHQMDDLEYIFDKIDQQELWGLFENQQLAGFIGMHNEGSMGLLEVLPQYRHRGYGMMLESFLINDCLENGKVPYCQVIEGNEASLNLQRKLGLEISNQFSYWLFD